MDLNTSGDGPILDPTSKLPPTYYLAIEFIGDGFLRHMIRRIIGTMRPIVAGLNHVHLPIDTIDGIFAGKVEAGQAVPARGLWLTKIWHDAEEWNTVQKTL